MLDVCSTGSDAGTVYSHRMFHFRHKPQEGRSLCVRISSIPSGPYIAHITSPFTLTAALACLLPLRDRRRHCEGLHVCCIQSFALVQCTRYHDVHDPSKERCGSRGTRKVQNFMSAIVRWETECIPSLAVRRGDLLTNGHSGTVAPTRAATALHHVM